jgi:hypothetical protein
MIGITRTSLLRLKGTFPARCVCVCASGGTRSGVGEGGCVSYIASHLCNYPHHKVDQGTFDGSANLSLLKLYQFHPEFLSPSVLQHILVKALMAFPSTWYLLCSYMVTDRATQSVDYLPLLNTLAYNMETARFTVCEGILFM